MRCALGWFAFNCHAIAYFPANVHKNINLHGGVMKKMFFNAKACLGAESTGKCKINGNV